jgi:selenide,water dikinase
MPPGVLAQVLRPLTLATHPDLIVGLQTSDDAAVFRLSPDRAMVQTVDFFPPIVDDPFLYGQIAAANSMSDVFAMGGEVALALNVAAWPADLDPALLGRVLEGGVVKVTEAGGIIAGGHTVTDPEPKYGLSVTGFVHPDRVLTKGGAQPGDLLYLTKALGTGVITTALKNDAVDERHLAAATASMLTLNRDAARAAVAASAHACTDITGFGLVGHAHEMAERSGARLVFEAALLPLLDGAIGYAEAGHIPGGLRRNRAHYTTATPGVTVDPSIHGSLNDLLYNPETSGGLLIAIAPEQNSVFLEACRAHGATAWPVGAVTAGAGVHVR